MLTEGANLFKRAVFMRIYTCKALGLELSPSKDDVFWWRPLLERMEAYVKHEGLDSSGMASLRAFTDIWDEQVRRLAAGEGGSMFSSSNVRAMTCFLADYESWLRTHFPNAFAPHGSSSN
jgi:hypothetical protein